MRGRGRTGTRLHGHNRENIIFAASGYLTQRELYTLGLITTLAFLAVYLLIGSPWVYFVMSGP